MGEKPKVISHLGAGEEEEEELLGLGRNRSCGSARRGAGQIQGIRKDSKISYKLSVLCCMKFPTRTLKLVGHTSTDTHINAIHHVKIGLQKICYITELSLLRA